MNYHSLTNAPFSVGVELPLDNDWSKAGQASRLQDGRAFGVPDMKEHRKRIQLADQLGFRAAWVRDVPLYDPDFGDAAQVFETFSYLGYLAGVTENILLGTAAVVLPLRQKWLVKKAMHSIAQLSNNRLLFGIASGDRPTEYPVFEVDYSQRGAAFRDAVNLLRQDKKGSLPEGMQVLPEAPQPPLLVAGLAQQTPAWIGEHMDGWLAYPGTPQDHIKRVKLWRSVAGNKPYISFIHLDLSEDPDAPTVWHRFGVQTGVKGLTEELEQMQAAGVNHIGLQFRRNSYPVEQAMQNIAETVLPHFHQLSHVPAINN